jgi:hypothetical protein
MISIPLSGNLKMTNIQHAVPRGVVRFNEQRASARR